MWNALWEHTAASVKNKHLNYVWKHVTYRSLAGAPTVSALWIGAPLCFLWCIGQWISLWRSVQDVKELNRCMWMQIDVKLCTNTSNMLLSDFDQWPAKWEGGSQLGMWNWDALQTASWYSPMWLNLQWNQWRIPNSSCRALTFCQARTRQSSMEIVACLTEVIQPWHRRAQWEPIPLGR